MSNPSELGRYEIQDALCRYAMAIDSRELDELDGCFTSAAIIELAGMGVFTVQEYKTLCGNLLTPLDATQHCIATVVIRVHQKHAFSRCYSTAYHLRNSLQPRPLFTVGGQYDDEWEYGASGWRIYRRVATVLWTDGNPSVLGLTDEPRGAPWTGARGWPRWLGAGAR